MKYSMIIIYGYIFIMFTIVTIITNLQKQVYSEIFKNVFALFAIIYLRSIDSKTSICFTIILLSFLVINILTTTFVSIPKKKLIFFTFYSVEFLLFLFTSYSENAGVKIAFIILFLGVTFLIEKKSLLLDILSLSIFLVFGSIVLNLPFSVLGIAIFLLLGELFFIIVAFVKNLRLTYHLAFASYCMTTLFLILFTAISVTNNSYVTTGILALLTGLILIVVLPILEAKLSLDFEIRKYTDGLTIFLVLMGAALILSKTHDLHLVVLAVLLFALVYNVVALYTDFYNSEMVSLFSFALSAVSYFIIIRYSGNLVGIANIFLIIALLYVFEKYTGGAYKKHLNLFSYSIILIPLVWRLVSVSSNALHISQRTASLAVSVALFAYILVVFSLASRKNNQVTERFSFVMIVFLLLKIIFYDFSYLEDLIKGVLFVAMGIIGFLIILQLQKYKDRKNQNE